MQQDFMTLGEVANHFHLQVWKIQQLFDRKILPPPQRAGRLRIIARSELDAVRQALVRAGYLAEPAGVNQQEPNTSPDRQPSDCVI